MEKEQMKLVICTKEGNVLITYPEMLDPLLHYLLHQSKIKIMKDEELGDHHIDHIIYDKFDI
jgi:hypothetical protein